MQHDLRSNIAHGRAKEIGGDFGDASAMTVETKARYETALRAAEQVHHGRYHLAKAIRESRESPTISVRAKLPALLAAARKLNEDVAGALATLGLAPLDTPVVACDG